MNNVSVLNLISNATRKNWSKLSVDFSASKLKSRANKLLSTKTIVPQECFNNIKNVSILNNIVSVIKEKNIELSKAVNSLCLSYLITNGLIDNNFICRHNNSANFVSQLTNNYVKELLYIKLPNDEQDFLGVIYQALLTEGVKSGIGSYYTPQNIIDNFYSDLKISNEENFLDPSCGSGRFILNINASNPNNIYGFDIDPIAVTIAKTNLIIKYKEVNFLPNIYCVDFLKLGFDLLSDNRFNELKFDYIITNPPWGTKHKENYIKYFNEIKSKELFSYFIIKSYSFLKTNGKLRFVLPESILNIKVHSDIRKFILSHFNIEKISKYGNVFTGVVSQVIGLFLKNNSSKQNNIIIENGNKTFLIKQEDFARNEDNIFALLNSNEIKLLKKIYKQPYLTLEKSVWGLGIVTGDNKNKIFSEKKNSNMLPIFTGKEVQKFVLFSPKHFFEYKRENFQQVAKDDIYLAEEKLIYKFISNKLVFSYDDKQNFVLNSANILIPKIKGMSIKTVCAFLNSDLMQFTYNKSFSTIKVLKGNVSKLPFPIISKEFNEKLTDLVDQQILGVDNNEIINNEIFKYYKLTDEEILLIRRSIK